ncbi:MAG: cytochrome c3 family protein [Thermoguttaceae bacterium]
MGGSPFPEWIDRTRPLMGALAAIVPLYLVGIVYYGGSPQTTDVGYAPVQPVPFSHALHAGDLGIDCRYCHNTVEIAADAAVPPTATCMNCHSMIATDSPKLLPVRESAASGLPVRWVRVHDLPDFVYFDHSAHVSRGVGCVSCHGRIDRMEVVYQAERLSMGWCLECHRHPEPHLRPPDAITDLDWTSAENPAVLGAGLREKNNINPSTDCSTCHR